MLINWAIDARQIVNFLRCDASNCKLPLLVQPIHQLPHFKLHAQQNREQIEYVRHCRPAIPVPQVPNHKFPKHSIQLEYYAYLLHLASQQIFVEYYALETAFTVEYYALD